MMINGNDYTNGKCRDVMQIRVKTCYFEHAVTVHIAYFRGAWIVFLENGDGENNGGTFNISGDCRILGDNGIGSDGDRGTDSRVMVVLTVKMVFICDCGSGGNGSSCG